MLSFIPRALAVTCLFLTTIGVGPARAAVVLNEILYHPANTAVQVGEDAEDLQFIELANTGATAVDVSGWSFAQGVAAPFPAGTTLPAQGYVVVARNPALLALRGPAIPTGVPIVPWTSGDLSNAGETLQLVDASTNLVDEVTYDDAGLWPAAADGAGSSLELANPTYDASFPLVWRASSGVNGTPGARNSAFTEGPLVSLVAPERGAVVADFAEVAITFAEPVSGVTAAQLTVDGSAATQVTCAPCVAGVGAGPWVFSGFAAPTSNPYTTTLAGGTVKDAEGHAFAGDSWQNYLSVPKVVLNEIHYNPASSTDVEEFIELVNADAVAVDLGGWRVAEFGSPGCSFPAGTLLQPGAFVVCAKDPAALLAATGYQAAFSWGTNDSLSNGGEPVALLNAAGAVVDRVVYGDAPPWPNGSGGPDGFGPSLELINPAVDNAVGSAWRASTTTNGTPGAPNSTYSDAPVVASELPGRGSVILGLTTVEITFSEAVTGVEADDLEVNGVPATGVTGEGAGPYVFTVQDPLLGVVDVTLASGAIADLAGTPFPGDTWLYFSSLPRIVLNEIHYHPAPDAVAAGEEAESLQFLELVNLEATAVDLSGYALAEGVELLFPAGTTLAPGGFLVVAADAAFLAAHVTIPASAQVLSWTAGDLSNNGEAIELSDAYGHVIDRVTYNDKGEWTDQPDGKGPSLELVNPALANDEGGAWQASTVANGTPGAPNSVLQVSPAPLVFGTVHRPAIPLANQALTITTTAIDDGGSPASVTLFYREDQDPPIAYASMPMFDDGLHGDGDASDGRYGAVVPGLADERQLDFYVEASDGAAVTVAPAGHATPNRFGHPSETYLAKFSNEVLPTDVPVFHVLVTLNNKHNQEALNTYPGRKEPFDATFIDGEGTIWYNVTERYRGQSSLFKLPSSYNIDFPSNRKLSSPLGFPVESLQLNAMRPAAQWLGFTLFNRAGMPAPKTAWARLRYPGINYDTCCTGQNGYYGLHVVVERYDDDFLDSQGGDVPDRGTSSEGNLYRGRNDANLRWEGTDPAAYFVNAAGQNGYEKYNNATKGVWGDLLSLCDAISNTASQLWVDHVKVHVDEDNWARYFALMMLLGNREGGIYLDTGDDYFIYFPPLGDPQSPAHPDFGTDQVPDDRVTSRSKLLPWDTDSVLLDAPYSIWRTNTLAPQTFLRHNAFAPIFVKDIEDLAANELSPEAVAALIDTMPDAAFGVAEGSDLWPETKEQYKHWIANRIPAALAETVDDLTLTGGPELTVEGADPVAHLGGQLQQAGTHAITVNGQPATFSVFQANWSFDLALVAGPNPVLVQAWDRNGVEKDRVEGQVFYNPTGAFHLNLQVRAPRRMVNDKVVTVEAAIVDPIGRVSWTQWDELGQVSVVRLPERTPVPITTTVFEDHHPVPNGSLRFLNGWGSVSFTLDEGAAFVPGDLEVSVRWHGLTASRTVTVLQAPTFRTMAGTLTGPALVWGPNENIRVTGNCTVPAGSTLTILPGTLVQVDTTGTLENGTLIVVQGTVQALGTRDSPIYFFSERGPAAMKLTQAGSASNGDAWRGFQFYGDGTSALRQVILTGAGNGNVVSHPRPPILGIFNTHSLFVDRCVFADDNGMVFSGQGTGTYTVRKTLLSRVGIGAEFFGNGHTLLLKDSWFTVAGRAPESENLDGDLLHVDGAASVQTIRSCILNDGGDDAIDHSASSFAVEHSIISHARDKACSMTGGHVSMHNVLVFATNSGIRGTGSTSYTTLAVPSPIATNDRVQTSVFWPASTSTCSGTVDYTDVGNPGHLGCGTGNLSTDPQFTNPTANDYNPRPGSPALTAGPNQDRIGWLGFPYGSVCKTSADCNDTNACTTDVCVDKLCTFTPIVGCTPCDIDEDCDDSDSCTVDTCAPDGACQHVPQTDGAPCDDGLGCTSPDTCSAGTCAGPVNCPGGGQCDASGACGVLQEALTFQDGVNGYSGTHDTFLRQSDPDVPQGADVLFRWDTEDPAPNQLIGLLRFADIIGDGERQVQPGSTILSAALVVTIEDPSQAPAGTIHVALVDWDEATATWNNYGGDAGVQDDEWGTQRGEAPIGPGAFTLDVTADLQAWLTAPAANHGWIFRPQSWDGIRASSSESATIANRPLLRVTFQPPVAGCTADAECDDGLACNGTETCHPLSHRCQAGAAMACDDGVPCTADACNEGSDLCEHTPADVLCDDGNLCTDDTCAATQGCRHENNAAACSDGDACTTGDTCAAGACKAGPALACDDGVPCTTDACDPAVGCTTEDACPAGQVCNATAGACEAGPTVITFQEGQAGYTGTVDTYVQAGQPDANFATSAVLVVDGATPEADLRHILLRFDDLFGDGPGQVPQGARIVSATLSLYVTNPSADGAELYRLLLPWSDTDTWTSLGAGVQPDGVEAASTPETSGATNSNKVFYDLDVTGSLIAWSGGEADLGWAFLMPEGGSDSWMFASSEDLEADLRPKLTVAYIPCEPGYVGDGVTCSDLDECQQGAGPCDPNATCTNSIGGYACSCLPGFSGDGATCADVDECQQGTGPCDPNASCTNTPGAFTCACKPGFEGNGAACADVDECQEDGGPCDPNASCTNSVGGYACACNPGFEGDGATCSDVDECQEDGGPCDPNATCTNLTGAWGCTCKPGFEGDGATCADVDECQQVPGPCGVHAACANGWGTFACSCEGGYVGDGLACSECPGGAASPCNGHGVCGGTAAVALCVCDTLYAGPACGQCATGYTGYPACTTCQDDCDDGNHCTADTCDAVEGCVHTFKAGSCDDGNPCTTGDACHAGLCSGNLLSCDDGDVCTSDACSTTVGCTHFAVVGCCHANGQCTPPGKCLHSKCDTYEHQCQTPETLSACCESDDDCDDGYVTTADTCNLATGACVNGPACADDASCDDGDLCTDDTCDGETGKCVYTPMEGCCGPNGCPDVLEGTPEVTPEVTPDAAEPPPTEVVDGHEAVGPDTANPDPGEPDAAGPDALHQDSIPIEPHDVTDDVSEGGLGGGSSSCEVGPRGTPTGLPALLVLLWSLALVSARRHRKPL